MTARTLFSAFLLLFLTSDARGRDQPSGVPGIRIGGYCCGRHEASLSSIALQYQASGSRQSNPTTLTLTELIVKCSVEQ